MVFLYFSCIADTLQTPSGPGGRLRIHIQMRFLILFVCALPFHFGHVILNQPVCNAYVNIVYKCIAHYLIHVTFLFFITLFFCII